MVKQVLKANYRFNMKVPFNLPPYTGKEKKYILKSMTSSHISADGKYTHKCQNWFEKNLNINKALLTSSCTHALEIAAILLNIQEGDEVIMPSYTFVSTANAFALRGAKIIFVDIREDTMNIDESKIEAAITKNTKAIITVHYAGIACEMDEIMRIADAYNLFVIEDAAQAIMSTYKGKTLGTIGHMGTYSFHETKNITSAGEGGLLILNDIKFIERAEVIREKGTNRSKFFRGEVDKYSWVDIGSSYLINDVSAAYLWAQIKHVKKITLNRFNTWSKYYNSLKELENNGLLTLPTVPKHNSHNGHLFYIKTNDAQTRALLLQFLKEHHIYATFHYVPLHTSLAGKKYGNFIGEDKYTTIESEKLLRLPMYYKLDDTKITYITNTIKKFYDSLY